MFLNMMNINFVEINLTENEPIVVLAFALTSLLNDRIISQLTTFFLECSFSIIRKVDCHANRSKRILRSSHL